MADDENAPATKKDLAEVKLEIGEKLSELEDRLSERIRDSQTEILKAFLPWQESVQTQFRKLEANMGTT
jgi:hypothetical protein